MGDFHFNNTITIIKQMYNGKLLTLPDGNKIGMGEDFSIGFVIRKNTETYGISTLSTLSFKDLFDIVVKYNIIPVPK